NEVDPRLLTRFLTGDTREAQARKWLTLLPRFRDDFAQPPLTRLATAGGKGAALHQYEREARVADGRLFRKVTLRLKAVPLSELCAALEKQTAVPLSAARGVADENVTILVKELPARDVMRE